MEDTVGTPLAWHDASKLGIIDRLRRSGPASILAKHIFVSDEVSSGLHKRTLR
jgi:hypothetical protein